MVAFGVMVRVGIGDSNCLTLSCRVRFGVWVGDSGILCTKEYFRCNVRVMVGAGGTFVQTRILELGTARLRLNLGCGGMEAMWGYGGHVEVHEGGLCAGEV